MFISKSSLIMNTNTDISLSKYVFYLVKSEITVDIAVSNERIHLCTSHDIEGMHSYKCVETCDCLFLYCHISFKIIKSIKKQN